MLVDTRRVRGAVRRVGPGEAAPDAAPCLSRADIVPDMGGGRAVIGPPPSVVLRLWRRDRPRYLPVLTNWTQRPWFVKGWPVAGSVKRA
jgi:hypothetical protein